MSDFNQSWISGFNELAIKIASQYKDNPERVLSSIGFKSVSDCLMETYNNLVREKEIPKLEDLSSDHKQALWAKSKNYSEEKFKRILICKCIYLLDVLTK